MFDALVSSSIFPTHLVFFTMKLSLYTNIVLYQHLIHVSSYVLFHKERKASQEWNKVWKRKLTILKMSLFCLPLVQYASTLVWILDEKHESVVPFAGFNSWMLLIEKSSPHNECDLVFHYLYFLTTCTTCTDFRFNFLWKHNSVCKVKSF